MSGLYSLEVLNYLIAGDLCEIPLLLQRLTTGCTGINAPQSVTVFMTVGTARAKGILDFFFSYQCFAFD